MKHSDSCTACRDQQKFTAISEPHTQLSLIGAKSFKDVMADSHDEYIYRCRTCGSILCLINHGNGRVMFWYIMDSAPEWANTSSDIEAEETK